MKFPFEALKSPFFVTHAHVQAAIGHYLSHEHFRTLDEARLKYDNLKAVPETYAYLGEFGLFEATTRLGGSRLIVDYMTFETNDEKWWCEVAYLNQMGSRGYGRASSESSFATKYFPATELGCVDWKMPK